MHVSIPKFSSLKPTDFKNNRNLWEVFSLLQISQYIVDFQIDLYSIYASLVSPNNIVLQVQTCPTTFIFLFAYHQKRINKTPSPTTY